MSITASNFLTDSFKPSSRPRLVLLALIYVIFACFSTYYNKFIHTHCYGATINNECRGHKFNQDNVMYLDMSFLFAAAAKG